MATRRTHDFHFARFYRGDKLDIALAHHEHYLFMKLRLKPGMRVLEVGCRSGAAALELVNFADVAVVGIDRNTAKIEEASIDNKLNSSHNFGSLSPDYFPPESFDAIYSIESLRYLPSFDMVYTQFAHLLKPGGKVALYEWCWTSTLDPGNAEHRRLAELIEDATKIGHRTLEQRSMPYALAALRRKNFVVLEYNDLAAENSTSSRSIGSEWYSPLEAALGDSRVTWEVQDQSFTILDGLSKDAVTALIFAGRFKLFTPMAMFVGYKS
ncbi:hypothetical protein NLJ89_g3085 [Agrocybe chaxingu]|uniref:S-adenosyl-L-methionine-dependent methyltransferase n=1 Tax=Agrocybe chaxingu TaxID=84603 RepID=A0A9W8K4P0_9AGAR|nr:hypothetical protein NLJ89_g3085 [Agrocybe chaxingu]